MEPDDVCILSDDDITNGGLAEAEEAHAIIKKDYEFIENFFTSITSDQLNINMSQGAEKVLKLANQIQSSYKLISLIENLPEPKNGQVDISGIEDIYS